MDNIHISHITTASPLYRQVWDLREDVLRKPLGLSLRNEDLRQDDADVIFIATKGAEVIGCVMLQSKSARDGKLRQMAVKAAYQGSGIGRLLVNAAEKYAIHAGYGQISLHARKSASIFYEKIGYQIIGNEFTEVGIPHFLMTKQLSSK